VAVASLYYPAKKVRLIVSDRYERISSLGSNPDTLKKFLKGRHKQKNGQHTLARKKYMQKDSVLRFRIRIDLALLDPDPDLH
jgi:hypothetical protein